MSRRKAKRSKKKGGKPVKHMSPEKWAKHKADKELAAALARLRDKKEGREVVMMDGAKVVLEYDKVKRGVHVKPYYLFKEEGGKVVPVTDAKEQEAVFDEMEM